MSVSRDEFAKLLDETLGAEFDSLLEPASGADHAFSDEFEARMKEIFKEKRAAKKKRLKRWVLIAVAAVILLTAAACAVTPIRESIAGFFVKVFGDHVEYSDPDVTKDTIEEEYGLVPIPEGLNESVELRTELMLLTYYSDSERVMIVLTQQTGAGIFDMVDNENGEFEECNIDGKSVLLSCSEKGAQASWIQDGYYFSLGYPSHIELSDFKALISLVGRK